MSGLMQLPLQNMEATYHLTIQFSKVIQLEFHLLHARRNFVTNIGQCFPVMQAIHLSGGRLDSIMTDLVTQVLYGLTEELTLLWL